MPSPFPGMNPYLEKRSVWEDFHQAFVTEMRNEISVQVRPNFIVKLEERVFIHEPSSDERMRMLGQPDVSILDPGHQGSVAVASSTAERLATLIGKIPDVEFEKHSYIEIRDRDKRELVTMIEVLSPSNKRYGPDREQYSNKRAVLLLSPVSIVEIDLLRGGPRFPLDDIPTTDYQVMISRKAMRPHVEAFAIPLRTMLPIIPIPLKGDVPDARLDLQALLHRVYDAAGYDDYLYESPPDPPLAEADAEWARNIIANRHSQPKT